MSNELQTDDMLNDFDFDSFLNDNDTEHLPFDYNAFGKQDDNGSQPDNDAESRADQASSTSSTIPRTDEMIRQKVTAREGTSSAAKHNMPLLLRSTISEDYSNKERVKRKLYCTMDKAFAHRPLKEGVDMAQLMPTNKQAFKLPKD